MKTLLILVSISLSLNASATHWLTYYVYVETVYSQGPWSRFVLMEHSDNKYLAPQIHEDLFGTLEEDMVNKMLSRLQENNPKIYDWNYTLSIQGDTVVLNTESEIEAFETVKNEVTATLTLNSFKAVTFAAKDVHKTFEIGDISLPFFDLVSNQVTASIPVSEAIKPITIIELDDVEPANDTSKPFFIWLLVSLVINMGLVGMLVLRNKNI